MYEPSKPTKFNISASIKLLNKQYRRNYTLQDFADNMHCSRESLSRISAKSAFSTVYAVVLCFYSFYPEYNYGCWDFCKYAQLLAIDDHSFIL